MPELPEVETIKRNLEKAIVGKKIVGVEVRKTKIFQGNPKEIIGKTIEGIERRGKILIVRLSGDKSLLIHFKLTGQLVWVPCSMFHVPCSEVVTLGHPIPFAESQLPAKTTHVIFEINGGRLFYNDLRQFGWIKVAEIGNWKLEIGNLGPEPLDFARGKPFANKEFTVDYLQKIFSKTSKPVKLVLMDQEKIAGIGNIYANEALFEAGIMPTRPAKSLVEEEIKKLREAIIKVL
ncbi:hypothetical protein HZB97_02065, partial [Candidatus Gottesmanbacteria bacterium]|nr:hypothetical protein [Candidatus Gottesmanbacteria bacterium]